MQVTTSCHRLEPYKTFFEIRIPSLFFGVELPVLKHVWAEKPFLPIFHADLFTNRANKAACASVKTCVRCDFFSTDMSKNGQTISIEPNDKK